MSFPCIDCGSQVRPRQHAIACDVCDRWQHRTCHTGRAKSWYIDGTFKVVKEPFTQLLSIHAFAKSEDDNTKQFPLAFFMMSSRRKRDYRAILRHLLTLIPNHRVKEIVVDFEMAMWRAIPHVLPDVRIRGCAFHWGQAVWRKIQELGLQASYRERDDTYRFCQKLLSLPFLPAEHIAATFQQLKDTVTTPALGSLCDYINDTWIEATTWKPSAWSVFNQAVRTNNDVEGWHRRLNHAACKSSLPFYLLLKLLSDETVLVSHELRLLSEEKVKRRQRKVYANMQRKLFSAWDKYLEGHITLQKLHRTCASLATPVQ